MALEQSRTVAFILLALLLGCGSIWAAKPEEQDRGYALLQILEANISNPQKYLPKFIKYNVTFDGGKYQLLRLTKQRTLSELSVNVIGKKGIVSKLNLNGHGGQDVAFYLDQSTRAAVTLSIPKSSGQTHHDISGTFYHNHALYSISDRRGSTHDLSGSTSASDKRGSTGHRINRVIIRHANSDHVDSHGDDRKVRSIDESRQESIYEDPHSAKAQELQGIRKRRQAKTGYTVDMIYVSDYYMYQRIQTFMGAANLPNTPSDVAREVAIILATAANQVNLIYNLIDTQTWTLTTNLAAMYIATSPEHSAWEYAYNSTTSKGRQTIHSGSVLSAFTTYLNASGYPRADHMALFTGFDMYSVSNGIYNYDEVGIANLGRACTPYGTAVVELISFTLLGEIHAHELGHSLNANHDGFFNSCNATYGYVMAPSQPSPTAPYYERFSNCSLAAISQYIAKNAVCLTTSMEPYNNFTALEPTYSVPLGMRYTVHDQCRMMFGTNFRASGGATIGQQLCYKLMCYDSTKNYSLWTSAGRALDGTPCGNNKWCVKGSCVYNSSAPAGSDTCPLGNQPLFFKIFTNSLLTCYTLTPSDCYDTKVADVCCGSCGALYNSSWPLCPYGDRRKDCAGSWVYNCNTPSWYTDCCKFCESNKLSIPGCPYGDYYGDCGTSTRPCATYPTECCKTCASSNGK